MPRFLPLHQPILETGQPLVRRLEGIHARIVAIEPAVSRLAFALYQPQNDLLSTYVSHNTTGPLLTFYDRRLATIPSLLALRDQRQCRVIDDLQGDAENLDFGYDEEFGSIAGTVVANSNGNGTAEPGETPVAGVTVTLTLANRPAGLGTR